jgi:hypothetical protein
VSAGGHGRARVRRPAWVMFLLNGAAFLQAANLLFG